MIIMEKAVSGSSRTRLGSSFRNSIYELLTNEPTLTVKEISERVGCTGTYCKRIIWEFNKAVK